MREIRFPNWSEALACTAIPDAQKHSWGIILKWYLGFCRRHRTGVTVQSAREFVAWAQKEKQAPAWRVERWKEAIRWFFREARDAEGGGLKTEDGSRRPEGGGQKPEIGGAGKTGGGDQKSAISQSRLRAGSAKANRQSPMDKAAMPAWKKEFLTVVRMRHYSYRTEESYLVWLDRFARFQRSNDLKGCGGEEIKAFLNELALDQRLSASSQKQALNAVVFLLREVYGKELGDFSDYRRSKVHAHAPVWLTSGEMQALLARLPGQWGLMTRVAFGGVCG